MIESNARQNECCQAIEPNPRAPSAGRVGAYRVTISLAASPPRLSASQPNPARLARRTCNTPATKK